MRVEFFRHSLGDREAAELTAVLGAKFLTYGPQTIAFEDELASFLGVTRVIGLSSCTSALFLTLKALGLGEGDEVITTPLTFVATSNAILHAGARPVFADVDPGTGNLDLRAVEQAITSRTKAIIAVHLYGQMVDVVAFAGLARGRGLFFVEDAAHCIEGTFAGARPGQKGHAAVFSFYATKNITSGEGGALATCDAALAERVRKLATHGLTKAAVDRYHGKFKPWDVEVLGYKANMFDIQAALLRPQLRRIDSIARTRAEATLRYRQLFREKCCSAVTFPEVAPAAASANHLFVIWCRVGTRDALMEHLVSKDIGVGINYSPVHLTSYYRRTFGHTDGAFPIAEDLGSRCLSLPFYETITEEEQAYVVDAIAEFYRRGQ
jgi:dTDP-4-amino-4,6-dideoxygalactose transaminase